VTTPDRLPSLYDYSEQMGSLLRFQRDEESPDRVDQGTGEVLTDEEFLARFEALDGSTEEKVKRAVAFQLDREADALDLRNKGEIVKAKAQVYFDAADRLDAAADRLDRLLLAVVRRREAAALEAGKKPKDARRIETPFGSVGYRVTERVEIDNASLIPRELYNPPRAAPPPTPDKDAIKQEIKAGVPVPGARLEVNVTLTRPKFDGETGPRALGRDA